MASDLPFLDQRTRQETIRNTRKQARARVQAKRHAPVRNRRLTLTVLLVSLSAVACGFLLTSPALTIRNVNVSVSLPVLAEELAAAKRASHIDSNTNLLRVSLKDMQSRLKALPWVQSASVRRIWPNGLRVQIEPRTPVALVDSRDGYWEVDREGVAIRPLTISVDCARIQPSEPAVCSAGKPVESPGLASALLAAAESRAGANVPIRSVKLDAQWEMWLTMQGDVEVRLGHYAEAPEKMAILRKIYKADPSIAEKVSRINLLSGEHPAVTPRLPEGTNRQSRMSRTENTETQQ